MPRHESPPTGISTEDWAATPPAVRALVETLLERLARLEERLNRTSRNSSQPPSSDPPHATSRPPRAASGRKAGGQPGHPGHGREFKPAAQVDRIIEAKPNAWEHCGALWLGDEPEPVRPQVRDLTLLGTICNACRCRT